MTDRAIPRVDRLAPAPVVANICEVPQPTLRAWASEGLIHRYNHRGRTLYDPIEVEQHKQRAGYIARPAETRTRRRESHG